jgi:hypothetical protein
LVVTSKYLRGNGLNQSEHHFICFKIPHQAEISRALHASISSWFVAFIVDLCVEKLIARRQDLFYRHVDVSHGG